MIADLLFLAVEGSGDTRLTLVVAGLFALALIIAVTTVVYWRLTRPEQVGNSGRPLEWENPR